MSMGESHAYMGESTESLSASSLILLLQVRRLLFLFHRPECTPSSVNRGLDSVRISMGEPHEHRRVA